MIFAAAYAVWLPLQPAFTRLVAAIAGPVLRLLDDPPLVSSLVVQGHVVQLYSFLTGFDAPMASWSGELMGVSVLAPLVLVLAAPVPRWPARLVAAVPVLVLMLALAAAIAVTQIKLVVEEHASSRFGITMHTAAERAALQRSNDGLHVVGMLALPALLFVATYAWGVWLPPGRAPAFRSRRFAVVIVGGAAAVTLLAAIGLAAVPQASRAAGDYHEGWARVLRLNPGFAPAQVNLALHFEEYDRLDEAIDLYRAAVGARPDLLLAHYNLGNALRKQQRHDEAVLSYGQVLRLDPSHGGAHRNLGLSLAALGRPCDAAVHLEQSTRHDPSAAANQRLLQEIDRLRATCEVAGREPLP